MVQRGATQLIYQTVKQNHIANHMRENVTVVVICWVCTVGRTGHIFTTHAH